MGVEEEEDEEESIPMKQFLEEIEQKKQLSENFQAPFELGENTEFWRAVDALTENSKAALKILNQNVPFLQNLLDDRQRRRLEKEVKFFSLSF